MNGLYLIGIKVCIFEYEIYQLYENTIVTCMMSCCVSDDCTCIYKKYSRNYRFKAIFGIDTYILYTSIQAKSGPMCLSRIDKHSLNDSYTMINTYSFLEYSPIPIKLKLN